MNHPKIFDPTIQSNFEKILQGKLQSSTEFASQRVIHSPRAVGDIVQEIIAEEIVNCFPDGLIAEYSQSFARRAMADVAFVDNENNYFCIDIKTHNQSTTFNMPNLTSVERLARFYEDDSNFFVILLVEYNINNNQIQFINIQFNPIEFLDWSCLTIGALGWGQIQITNSNNVIIIPQLRKQWMLKLCDTLDIFYPKEISKITQRINRFQSIRNFWLKK